MTDFSKILNKAKELEAKMKESQEKIKNIQVQGISGANAVQVTLNGDGEMIKLEISPEIIILSFSARIDVIKTRKNINKIFKGYAIFSPFPRK